MFGILLFSRQMNAILMLHLNVKKAVSASRPRGCVTVKRIVYSGTKRITVYAR